MITVFVEAYNKTIDVVFRVLDWAKGRPQRKLNNEREELEKLSRVAQMKGDVDALRRIRARIEEIDRDSQSMHH